MVTIKNTLKKILMPTKIKIFLSLYIFIIGILVILFENLFGNSNLILSIIFLIFLMILGIWIFPEVVTKKKLDNEK
tara:strand:- start:1145 stop:1372 length:228 start_codon:yes stop_codon:yes gene_type:complete